jgi:DNA-binding transcriptional LysR family regulator
MLAAVEVRLPRPSPYQIAAFTEAARARSISAAAARLGVTQSSVTQHVAKLEAHVGTPLFVRRREGLALTRAGRELFEITDRLRTMEEIVEERLTRFAALSSGSLRIVANAPRPALEVIAAFGEAHPGVEIDFRLGTWEAVRRGLRDREVDVAFQTDPEPGHGFASREVGATRYRAYLRRDHPLAGAASLSLATLGTETLVVPEDGSLTQRILRARFAAAGLPLPRLLKTGTFPLVKEAVLVGAGVGVMLERSVHDASSLVALPIEEMAETYRVHLMTQPERRELRLVRRFFETAADLGAESASPAPRTPSDPRGSPRRARKA